MVMKCVKWYFYYCRVSPRRASFFLAARQERNQRNAPRRPGLRLPSLQTTSPAGR